MAFDQKTRNLLQRTVAACRRALDREFAEQLQQLYGIQPDGLITPWSELDHLGADELEAARLLRERINHLEGGAAAEALTRTQALPEHIARVIREQAFTVLNRIAALRLCEERGLVLECVRKGVTSEGFQLFLSSAGNALGDTHHAYRIYLQCLFDELSLDLGVLFDRFSPLALLFPRHDALTEVLKELNGSGKAAEHEDLSPEKFAEVWQADETIGWIYQYYNDEAERKRMREESAAPRNSRELAVRNQFFTPRYVVEFLTDNTLGRIWYEMTDGETQLSGQCRYLVRRPTEVFLKPSETAPEEQNQDDFSQEGLLQQPVHIPHRPLKDPRTILMLDPACGSMHFGLYAFDLLEVIYDEAWALEEKLGADALSRPLGMKSLRDTYAGKDAFLKDVPRLIIEHNLHGIDIDPRCAQIAGLSLWLRAQKAWQRLGLKPAERPEIKRSNIVCAEPMPGEKELLREFVEREFPAEERGVCLQLLETIFDKMQLAGEAGSLLKIEEEVRRAIEEARNQAITPHLFNADVRSLTAEGFWERIEARIYGALRDYAEQAEAGRAFQRRLFAEDAARGFAFIDVCRKPYDVVLMNPPFGDSSVAAKKYLEATFGDVRIDLYKLFIELHCDRLEPGSFLGAITSRTGFFLGQSADWRRSVLLNQFRPQFFADLGGGVLDAAVDTAACVLRKLTRLEKTKLLEGFLVQMDALPPDVQAAFGLVDYQRARGGVRRHLAERELEWLVQEGYVSRTGQKQTRFSIERDRRPSRIVQSQTPGEWMLAFRLLDKDNKADALAKLANDTQSSGRYAIRTASFLRIPNAPFSYWIGESVLRLFSTQPKLEGEGRIIRQGLETGDDSRFVRTWWEIPADRRVAGDATSASIDFAEQTHAGKEWVPFAKGGAGASRMDIHLTLNWRNEGAEMKAWAEGLYDNSGWSRLIQSVDYYFKAGLTFGRRVRRFSVSPMPKGVIFSGNNPTIFFDDYESFSWLRSYLGSGIVRGILGLLTVPRKMEVGYVGSIPIPQRVSKPAADYLRGQADSDWRAAYFTARNSECDIAFVGAREKEGLTPEAAGASAKLDDCVAKLLSLGPRDVDDLLSQLASATGIASESGVSEDVVEEVEDESDTPSDIVDAASRASYLFGCAFGRWDIRYATGEQAPPELPDPFAPLPVCPPGQLQNAQGLPARPEDVPAAYPVGIPWDGILVDEPNHPLDIDRRVHEVIEVIWGAAVPQAPAGASGADAIEQEACETLGVKSLREYFRKPAGFFADHLKRYSKSRRQAPIYWPLSTASGSYTLWIYYHRLTPDTLYKCIQQFVNPKLADLEKELTHLRAVLAANEGGTKERKRTEELETLRRELLDLRSELELWAPKWKPNLNDGVLINASPLWKLFRLPKWQKDLKACWLTLEKGGYDWAHLAYTLWPDRVREKCKADRSLAIAHGLEDLCAVSLPAKKQKGKKKAEAEQTTMKMEGAPAKRRRHTATPRL